VAGCGNSFAKHKRATGGTGPGAPGPELIGIGILAVVFGPLIMRIYCEWLIVLFRINDTLTDIRRNTERGGR